MANTKQQLGSAAQRRERVRQQRQPGNTRQTTTSPARRRARRTARSNPWPVIIGTMVLVLAAVGLIIFIANQPKGNTAVKADPGVFKTLTSIKSDTLSSVGRGDVSDTMSSLLKPVKGTPVLKGNSGKPQVFYMGGEFCPYCAAQRWSLIVALSRFGTFSSLDAILASEGNVPTYTFDKSTYTSQYLDFVPVEVQDNSQPPKELEKLSPEQQQIVNTYDAPPYTDRAGSFPFISYGNQIVSVGAYYDYNLLIGTSHQDIVKQLNDKNSDFAKSILGGANYMTAAICSLTQNQPAAVCTSGTVPQIQNSLPKAQVAPVEQHFASIGSQQDALVRRQE